MTEPTPINAEVKDGAKKTPASVIKAAKAKLANRDFSAFEKEVEAAVEKVTTAERTVKLAQKELQAIVDKFEADNA